MNLSVEETVAVFRSLDPASQREATSSAEIDATLRTILASDDAVHVDLGVFETKRSRRSRIALVAASVLAVAAVAAGVAATRDRSHRAGIEPLGPSSSSTAAPPPGVTLLPPQNDPHYRAAVAIVSRVTARLPAMPGSKEVPSPPLVDLKAVGTATPEGHLVRLSRYWTTTDTFQHVASFFSSHRPFGTGSGSTPQWSNSAGVGSPVWYLLYDRSDGGIAEVVINIQTYPGGVAVGINVERAWQSTKPAGLYLGSVDSVDVTVDRSDGRSTGHHVPTIRQSLGKEQAQLLASLVDDDPPAAPSTNGACPGGPDYFDRLVFHVGTRMASVVTQLRPCGHVVLSIDGATALLDDSRDQLDSQLMKLVGLPAGYGR